ncbi:MAG: deiodinase [Candidatus Solibacter usitatus]|nr:deiodinase [Candidatus Solibacter usitatus]
MYRAYKDRAAFFVIYIQEAHPSDAWQMAINVKQNVVLANPKTFEERTGVAQTCGRKLGIELPALIDGIQNSTEAAYTGWPDRLYVIDRDGKVAFKSAPGPFGFSVKGLEEALRRVAPAS